jgi:hypothetical protein
LSTGTGTNGTVGMRVVQVVQGVKRAGATVAQVGRETAKAFTDVQLRTSSYNPDYPTPVPFGVTLDKDGKWPAPFKSRLPDGRLERALEWILG